MKKQNYRSIDSYDLSDYKEVTGNDLYKINGGKEIENSIAAQAEAQPGDSVTNSHGETRVLTEGDIKWAQQQMENRTSGESSGTRDEDSPGENTTNLYGCSSTNGSPNPDNYDVDSSNISNNDLSNQRAKSGYSNNTKNDAVYKMIFS